MRILTLIFASILSLAMLAGCATNPGATTQPAPILTPADALSIAETTDSVAWSIVQADHDAGKLSAQQWSDYQSAQTTFTAVDAQLQADIAAGKPVTVAQIEQAVGPILLKVAVGHVIQAVAASGKK